jgi:hypothetical protein
VSFGNGVGNGIANGVGNGTVIAFSQPALPIHTIASPIAADRLARRV